mgnify:CR=1 FL=1
MDNNDLVKKLVEEGVVLTSKIRRAFKRVDRQDFVPLSEKDYSYLDLPLSIGSGQTISQPTTVATMLELLKVDKGMKILDIGAGSGWVSVLLAEIIGQKGKVYAYEINSAVGRAGQKNLEKFNYKNIIYKIADATEYWDRNSPYDRIIAGTSFSKIPRNLIEKLTVGGIAVIPTKDNYLVKIMRTKKDSYKEERFYGFVFVPFLE